MWSEQNNKGPELLRCHFGTDQRDVTAALTPQGAGGSEQSVFLGAKSMNVSPLYEIRPRKEECSLPLAPELCRCPESLCHFHQGTAPFPPEKPGHLGQFQSYLQEDKSLNFDVFNSKVHKRSQTIILGNSEVLLQPPCEPRRCRGVAARGNALLPPAPPPFASGANRETPTLSSTPWVTQPRWSGITHPTPAPQR